ncbi:SMEK domain-containing protein [Candidatus Nitrospira allomarina]|uniref:SMEK domain-containing protein n=1 Tax=Candidatus Nitrospira allomarina TaxID=3020900 RepID=A0AA96GEJ6_9BACT|nr:SMEK domain-containing protein [Candidatus Nitrospira allomarina]WNM59707.1 SMEK domain-containing protein [Candidatus Nitrospira allomarina]
MNRQGYQSSIISSLSWLSTQVSVSNGMNFTDINIHSENFYRNLLNLAFGYSLININIIEQNSTAIDLGDQANRIAIQVTSTSTLDKTKNTVDKFIKKKLYEKYDRLVILNIVKKKDHKVPNIGNKFYNLDTKNDIWDIGILAKMFNNLGTPKLEKINDFLNSELYQKPTEELPKNVQTILSLIELISDEDHPAIGDGYLTDPFPDEKINQRFSNHAVFLKTEFLTLYQDYGAVLEAIEKESDIGQVKLRRVAQHLRVFSDKVLTECDGNPKNALARIIEYFVTLLQTKGFAADTGAAQFYIVKHLIKCNVFPNKETDLV